MKFIKYILFIIILFIIILIFVSFEKNSEVDFYEPKTPIVDNLENYMLNVTSTPNNNLASQETKNLMKTFAKTMNSSRIFSGHNIGSANYLLEQNYEASVIELEEYTGKTPAILSLDYAWETSLEDYSKTNTLLKKHLSEGGLIMVSIHPGNPFLEGGLYTKGTGDFVFDDLFTPGTEPYVFWQKILRETADGLEELQRDNVILWRPLHEMNGAWFWWGGGDSDQITQEEFKKLWLSVYTYFEERELNNLLWVYSPNGNYDETSTIDVLALYPGDEYVDIVALDYYYDTFSLVNADDSVEKLLSLNKPFGFAEIGQKSRKKINNNDILDDVKKNFPQTAFAIHWHTNTDQLITVPRSIIDNDNAWEYMNDQRTITLDELN